MSANTERVQLWIDALRSGEYKQIKSQLGKDGVGYCCLGVACEVAIQNGLAIERTVNSRGDIDFDEGGCELTSTVMEWYGFDNECVELEDKTAMGLNDTYEYTFSQIADEVERVYHV